MVIVQRAGADVLIRSRSVTGLQLAGFLAFGLGLSALTAWPLLLGRGQRVELDCSAERGDCRERVDGVETWRVALGEIEGVAVKPVRRGRSPTYSPFLLTGSAEHGAGMPTGDRKAAEAEAERLRRWLDGRNPAPLRTEVDLRVRSAAWWTFLTAIFLLPAAMGALQTRCRIPAGADFVEVRLLLRRARRRSEFSAVGIQRGDDHVREHWRRAAGTHGAVVTPPEQRLRSMRKLRRVVLETPAGAKFPVTDWLTERDDPGPAAGAAAAALGLAPVASPSLAEQGRGADTAPPAPSPAASAGPGPHLPARVAATVPRDEQVRIAVAGYLVTDGRLIHWGRRTRPALAWMAGGALFAGLVGAVVELRGLVPFRAPFPGFVALSGLLLGAASALRGTAEWLRQDVRWDAEAGEIREVGEVGPAGAPGAFTLKVDTARGERRLGVRGREEAEQLRGAIVALRDGAGRAFP